MQWVKVTKGAFEEVPGETGGAGRWVGTVETEQSGEWCGFLVRFLLSPLSGLWF